ncbi:MAG: sulfatase [Acidobacteriota bacterium]|nr:sulfatase [Acidobacteriota bacterium]
MLRHRYTRRNVLAFVAIVSVVCFALVSKSKKQSVVDARTQTIQTSVMKLARIPGSKPRNVVFILTDDHRFDAMSFMNHPFLETPNMDRLARNGVHMQNAFVTTSLCSPSRASILTGLYAHRHRVIDNNNLIPPGTIFFPQYLQQAGYETAFVGKWHMGGETDDPQPGFDSWVSFKGQGTYLPNPNGLNVNGKRVPQKGYITDELTDYAIDWLDKRSSSSDKPFMLYLAHKAVHVDLIPDADGRGSVLLPGAEGKLEFIAAPRHKGRYKDKAFAAPKTMANTVENYQGKPMWVQNARNSRLGVDFPFYTTVEIAEYHKQYAETLLAVDESIGRVMDSLHQKNLLDSTLIVYMGDNGYSFGEHGLVDKRTAYEESMRVPMLMHCPELFKGGTKLKQIIANIDIAPTILEAAGLTAPDHMDGRSFVAVAQGKSVPWRDTLLYEYYWERNYPMMPTMHAVRGDQYKYIRYQGIWDTDELYDVQADPLETKNLIRSPEHNQIAKNLNRQLFKILGETQGMYLPLNPDQGDQVNQRRLGGAEAADFPSYLMRK